MSAPKLIPCPVCGSAPNRFFVSQQHIEVIACPKGCKTHAIGFVIHITSVQAPTWKDLGDAWNTMRTTPRDDGLGLHVSFDAYPPHIHAIKFPAGPFNKWSPEISQRKAMERAHHD